MGGSNFTTGAPQPSTTQPEPTLSKEEMVKIEFYKTYDVMTGVRIAATLGGFFSLMVLLVVYKSKCKSRSLSEENLEAAVAAAAVEEEKLEDELRAAGFLRLYPGRSSLGNMSAPVYPGTRFSSVGGGYSLFAPPLRLGFSPRARVSLPTSSPFVYPSPYFQRPLVLDEPPPKPYAQVIQPTPQISPCESQHSLYRCPTRTVPKEGGLDVPRIAPLASISSCGLPSVDQDNHSVGSDSVFLDEELIDTEDEVEEFSTDSDADNPESEMPSNKEPKVVRKSSKKQPDTSKENRVPIRRFSTPIPFSPRGDNQIRRPESIESSNSPSTSKMISERKVSRLTLVKTSSDSDTIHVSTGADETHGKFNKSISVPRAYMSVSCDHLAKILQEHSSEAEANPTTLVEHCTWSQETLF